MNVPRLTERDRRTLLFGATAVTALLALRFGVLPFAEAIRGAEQSLAMEQALLERERGLLRRTRGHPLRFDSAASEFLSRAAWMLPGSTTAEAEVELSKRIGHAAEGSRVLVQRVEPLTARPLPPGFLLHRLSVAGEGDLEGILTLLAMVEAGPRLLQVEDLVLSASAEDPSPGPLAPTTGLSAERIRFTLTVSGIGLAADSASSQEAPSLRTRSATPTTRADAEVELE